MSLQEKLDEHKRRFLVSGKATPAMQTIMRRSTEQLRASGIRERVLHVGQPAPQFDLPNQDGRPISLQSLTREASVVISFFRGVW